MRFRLIPAIVGLTLDWLAAELADRMPPRRPRRPRVTLVSEEGHMLKYQVVLDPPVDADVVKREAEVVVDGGEPTVLDVTDPTADSALIRIDQGQSAVVRARDTDDAGNVSDWSESFTFTGADTLAPSAPGVPGVMLIGEE